MKILPFKIPKTSNQSFWLQTDYETHFYDFLHQHPEVQITLIIESVGKLIAGDYVGEFKPGDIYVIGSNLPHVFLNDQKYYAEGSTLMAHSISVFFEWKIFGQTIMQLPEMKSIKEYSRFTERGLYYSADVNGNIEKIMKRLFKIPQEAKFFTLLNLLNELSVVKDIKFLANAGTSTAFSEIDGKRLDAIYRFTMNEYHRKITLEEVADVANLTVNSFCRYFKKRTRKSYVDFLSEVRIGQACKFLQEDELSVSDICEKIGFNNLSNFNRKFKEINKLSPSNYRKNHQKLLSN